MEKDADGQEPREGQAPPSAEEREEERIAVAGRKGRRVGTVIMVVFGTWFVLTTVYNFAVNVFPGVFGEK